MQAHRMLASSIAVFVAGCGAKSTITSVAPQQATRPSIGRGASPAGTSASIPSACNPATSTVACTIERINLKSPTSSSTSGIAEVLKKGTSAAIAVVGEGLPANTSHNAYALWLYNSGSDAVRLGFVNPGVGKNGRLATAGGLPANAGRYKQLLVTLETLPNPRTPGRIVLEGRFAE
jgi:hypothetical protein